MSYHGYWVSKYGSRRLYGVNTIHYSTPSSYSLDDSKFLPTIFTCSKNLKGTLISYFHEWLRKEQDSFSAIDANVRYQPHFLIIVNTKISYYSLLFLLSGY